MLSQFFSFRLWIKKGITPTWDLFENAKLYTAGFNFIAGSHFHLLGNYGLTSSSFIIAVFIEFWPIIQKSKRF